MSIYHLDISNVDIPYGYIECRSIIWIYRISIYRISIYHIDISNMNISYRYIGYRFIIWIYRISIYRISICRISMKFNENPWESMKMNENRWNLMKINEHLWNLMKISKNKWKSMKIWWSSGRHRYDAAMLRGPPGLKVNWYGHLLYRYII